jgi:putative membrane protein
MQFIVHILVSAALLYLVGKLVDGIEVDGAGPAVMGAVMLGLANVFVRPLLIVLTLPVTIITLGLFIWVVNAIVLMLAAALVPGFRVRGLWPALVGSLALGIMNWVAGIVVG